MLVPPNRNVLWAVTERHPWAYAMFHLGKDVENRTWPLPEQYVGLPLAIHGGVPPKGRALREAYEDYVTLGMQRLMPYKIPFEQTVTPGIVGLLKVERNVTAMTSQWFAGPCGWVLTDKLWFDEPIPCRGAQGVWSVPSEIARLVWDRVERQDYNYAD